ncbi:MAG: DUF3618 domain-containing protein [Gemmatimonadaceae bacterium]|nr:DUF3618 domain-containing protein [Gemmatimonadaceae bacterium]
MVETTEEVRRDIEITRERMSDTIAQLERKFDVVQVVRDNPLPALALALGAGFFFARSSRRTKNSAGTAIAGGVARAKVVGVFDDVATRLLGGVTDVLGQRVDGWVDNLREAIVPPSNNGNAHRRAD